MDVIEWLAIPQWDAPPRTLEDWRGAFESRGYDGTVEVEPDATWLFVDQLGLKAFAVIESERLVALHMEVPDRKEAVELVEQIAVELDWELHDDEEEDDVEND